MPGKEWLPIGEAAKRLGFGLTKMRELVDEERPMFDVIIINEAGYRRVSAASIDEYLRVSRIRSKSEREAAQEALRRRYTPTDPEVDEVQKLASALGSDAEVRALDKRIDDINRAIGE